ncbi:MAG: Uma2 family endonuclease [Thermostichales cyanobacterium SZTDM-1c_bins_54]
MLPKATSLPTMEDLPSENIGDPGVPDEFHLMQPELLRQTFCPPNYPAEQVFSACDLNLYYDLNHTHWYKRPDWFGVVGVPRLYRGQDLRLSYVIWQEQVAPLVVVELLSPGTEKEDLGQTASDPEEPPTKWTVYQDILRVPYYIVFDRYTDRLYAFRLVGDRYQPFVPTGKGLWLPEVALGLGLWQGSYRGLQRLWLRWYDQAGHWIPTTEELLEQERLRAEQERQRAEQERQRAEQERQRAEQLAAYLRRLGIDPATIVAQDLP